MCELSLWLKATRVAPDSFQSLKKNTCEEEKLTNLLSLNQMI